MKKLLSILVFSLLLGGSAYAEVMDLVCTPLSGKKETTTLSINTKTEKVRWQGSGSQNTYNLKNGIFGYTQTIDSNKMHFRHSLNRHSGILTVRVYDFDSDDKKYSQFMDSVKIKLDKAKKTTKDDLVFFTIYYEELGNIKSDFDFKFNCEKSEKKF